MTTLNRLRINLPASALVLSLLLSSTWLKSISYASLHVSALCDESQYYDPIDEMCVECSDVCAPGRPAEFCRVNCPQYMASQAESENQPAEFHGGPAAAVIILPSTSPEMPLHWTVLTSNTDHEVDDRSMFTMLIVTSSLFVLSVIVLLTVLSMFSIVCVRRWKNFPKNLRCLFCCSEKSTDRCDYERRQGEQCKRVECAGSASVGPSGVGTMHDSVCSSSQQQLPVDADVHRSLPLPQIPEQDAASSALNSCSNYEVPTKPTPTLISFEITIPMQPPAAGCEHVQNFHRT